jgi:DNA-directed RNA polymerase subunit RPC12/RpoP
MLDVVANLLFRCSHRRLTRPITPVTKPGEGDGGTYVVCLECGKQFHYDWENMRMGRAVEHGTSHGVFPPDMPTPKKSRGKLAVLGAAIPLGMLLGRALISKGPKEPRK